MRYMYMRLQFINLLNNFITAYLPVKYQINCTDEFLDINKTTDVHGTIAA